MRAFTPRTTKTTIAARGNAQVAAALAGHPTSMMEVWIPQFATMLVTESATWATNQLITMLTPAKPIPTSKADFSKTLIFTRKMRPRIKMIIGIMTIGPIEAMVWRPVTTKSIASTS